MKGREKTSTSRAMGRPNQGNCSKWQLSVAFIFKRIRSFHLRRHERHFAPQSETALDKLWAIHIIPPSVTSQTCLEKAWASEYVSLYTISEHILAQLLHVCSEVPCVDNVFEACVSMASADCLRLRFYHRVELVYSSATSDREQMHSEETS